MERNKIVYGKVGEIFRAISDPDAQIVMGILARRLAVTSLQVAAEVRLDPDRANAILGTLSRTGLAESNDGSIFNISTLGLETNRMVTRMHRVVVDSLNESVREVSLRRMRENYRQ